MKIAAPVLRVGSLHHGLWSGRVSRPVARGKIRKGLFPWAASGRAIANGRRDEGFTKLLCDDSPEAHGSCTDLPPTRK